MARIGGKGFGSGRMEKDRSSMWFGTRAQVEGVVACHRRGVRPAGVLTSSMAKLTLSCERSMSCL